MENIKIYRGSEWRRWDLHIHSNASDGTAIPAEIIEEAQSKKLAVIALTDHHTVKNIDEIKRLGHDAGIVVISGIEFRTEYGSKSVHMIGLFPDSYDGKLLDSKALNELVLCPLGLSETEIISKGKSSDPTLDDVAAFKAGMFLVQVDFKKAADLVHKYGGLVSVHAGSKTNTIEEMKHDGSSPKNVNYLYDSLGTVKEELLSKYIDICEIRKENDSEKFYHSQFNLPSIIASDAHDKGCIGSKFVWIKADTTFEGLKQICFEPTERVIIQETKPEEKAGYQVIDSIKFNGGIFYPQTLYLNPNLNTIIGGRSTGKSSLLQCIACVIDPTKYKPESKFLEENVNNIEIKWQDQEAQLPRDIEYLPQSHMYEIAQNSAKLNSIIISIIQSKDSQNLLQTFDNDISNLNLDINQKVAFLFRLHKQFTSLFQIIKERGESNSIQTEIKNLESKLEELKSTIDLSSDELQQIDQQNVKYAQHIEKITTIQNDIKSLETLRGKSIINDNIIYDFNVLSEIVAPDITKSFSELKQQANQEWQTNIDKFISKLESDLQTRQKQCETIASSDLYKKGLQVIEGNKAYKDIQERLDAEKKKLGEIKDVETKIGQIKTQKDNLMQDILNLHNSIYTKTDILVSKLETSHNGIDIKPTVKYQLNKLQSFLESRLNLRGYERQEYVKNIIDSYMTDKQKVLSIFIEKNLMSQIDYKNGNNAENTIAELLSTNWSEIVFELTYQDDKFIEMSQGKQAFVILKLLLEFSDKKCPILIDQPEDSLDNRAIYSELVEYLKTKKKERQIILVTHNSNVVVSADAELIIVANQHGKNSKNRDNAKFQYIAGSLENTSPKDTATEFILESQGIREHVCEILEGGRQAFENREKKYGFKQIS
ncbi:TrlF family AAA-like ATPase [uncultured Alistipes sp.]|uniref:TrlF family AAA-like ATPase n=1 Tax=uncultured Alistipes sp. TaxID=538949 RepID=UPI00272B68AF|nr:PHP domain-containing protein [uncultured Alistipes sp.]